MSEIRNSVFEDGPGVELSKVVLDKRLDLPLCKVEEHSGYFSETGAVAESTQNDPLHTSCKVVLRHSFGLGCWGVV